MNSIEQLIWVLENNVNILTHSVQGVWKKVIHLRFGQIFFEVLEHFCPKRKTQVKRAWELESRVFEPWESFQIDESQREVAVKCERESQLLPDKKPVTLKFSSSFL